MIDKKHKIMFIVMGAIVIISIIAALYSNHLDKLKRENNTNNTSRATNTSNATNQNMEVKNQITVGNETYKNQQAEISTDGINEQAKQKIETYLNNYYEKVWNEIGQQYGEEAIKEMLSQEHDVSYGDVGFNQSFQEVFKNDKVVSYSYSMLGNVRGTAWEEIDGISFDVNTGEPIKIEDILTSKEGYIAICKQYVKACLENDKRSSMLDSGYESVVDEHIENLEGYMDEDGIVCIMIQKYEIASGAAGTFKYTIPYELVKDYIKSEYVF